MWLVWLSSGRGVRDRYQLRSENRDHELMLRNLEIAKLKVGHKGYVWAEYVQRVV